ncbi:O-antigen ligase family protein [Gemmatirosa kalamazoonensis]|uniref:O-antigen ligase family protein n=1 Tax=Gemmatirosa kalamazoonensis TaxID=861299 RepID=UPI00046D30B8|nr:O-antigen ligase family protein [Gemmatirosa kalamazoonensis]
MAIASAAAAADVKLYWEKAWMAATALTVILVIRLLEVYAPLAALHPAVLGVFASVSVLLVRTPGKAWNTALRDRQLRATLFYCVIICLNVPFGLWRGGSMPTVNALPYLIALTVVMLLVQPKRQDLDRLMNWTVIFGGVFAAYTALIARTRFDVVGGARLSTYGSYDSNDLASMMSMLMLLAIGMAMRTRGRWRLAALGCLTIMFVVFVKTGSRGGVVAFALATSVLLLGQNIRRFVVLVLALGIALPAAWTFGPRTFRVRTMSLFTIEQDYTYTSHQGRIEIWKRGLGYFAESPILGVGPNNFPVRDGAALTQMGIPGSWLTAHNTYVQAMVEVGIFGIGGLLYMLYRAARDALPLYRPRSRGPTKLHRPEILAALISFATAAFFLSHAYSYLLFYAVGLCALARRVRAAEMAGATSALPRPVAQAPSRVLGRGRPAFRPRHAAIPPHRP